VLIRFEIKGKHGQMALLEGIRIIDLTTVIFGPYATQMLADLGADVIKIETLSGDPPRHMGRSRNTPLMGGTHLTVNRGKRSIVLDLKKAEDADVLNQLIATADVFVHNVRAKAIERLGFGYEALSALKPDLIYAHFSGYDQKGPMADAPAYDDVIQAATGTTSLLPMTDGQDRPRYFPSLIADKVSGTYGAQSILAALVHKFRTGEGQKIEVPMMECFTAFMMTEHLQDSVFDPPLGPAGYPRQIDRERQPFPTKNGYITIVPYSDANLVKLFNILGDETFMTSPPFDTPVGRFKNMTAIYARMAALTPAKTSEDWIAILSADDYPVMRVYTLDEVIDHPQLVATDFFKRREHPTEGAFFEMRPPVRYSSMPDTHLGFAPTLGQHNEEIRKMLSEHDKRDA
jgi:crotonobetainyl-CoA:carnitine CoA-transferase CaiB-like acyl-CoA transferase